MCLTHENSGFRNVQSGFGIVFNFLLMIVGGFFI